MNYFPYNVKTFNFFLALVTFANFWFGEMVFSFASKTFLTISWTVSGSFYMASLTINAIILFISSSRIDIFLVCVVIDI